MELLFALLILFSISVMADEGGLENSLDKVFGEDSEFFRNLESKPNSSDLKVYKDKMKQLHQVTVRDGTREFLLATITFDHPLHPYEALRLIQYYEILPRLTYIFAKSANDELVTLGVYSNAKQSGSDSLMAEIDTFEEVAKKEIIGVASVVGFIRPENLIALQNETDVFLVDISADKKFGRNNESKDYRHHFGWYLYHRNK